MASNAQGVGGRRFSTRIHLIICGIGLLTLLTAMITWAATSIGPAPRIAVTLASTDYRDNLDLPPNGYGDRAVGRLASWVTGGKVGLRRNIRLALPPITLSTKADLSLVETDTEADVSITFVSAHGLSTKQGAAILPSDAESVEDAFLVRELLDRLASFPADQQKFLLLDCAHFTTNESFGVLLNDFARQMQNLDDQVRQIPNLAVLVSADTDQQTWIDPASGTTAWSDAIIKALNGNAADTNGDGWIDMFEVHRSALQATQAWVEGACQQSQTAFMLPSGHESVKRCRFAGLYPIRSEGVDIPNLASKVREDQLERWWDKHQNFASQEPSPIVRHPVTWRRFEQTLLRFEHFELAGCRTAADSLRSQLTDLAATLETPTRIESVTCHSGVVSPEAVGFVADEQLDLVAKQLASLLPELPISEAAERWLGVVAEQPNAASIAYLRRAVIEQRVQRVTRAFRDEVDVDRDLLGRTAKLIRAISDPLHPVPQVGQVLQLIARDLPSAPLQSKDATNIARFLELTVRSDRVSSGSIWWAPSEFRWVKSLVESADENRRLAGDLLMGDADSRRRSESYLANAESEYRQVDEIAACVREAEHALAGGPHKLQEIMTLVRMRSTYETGDSFVQHADEIASLYRELDRLATRLTGPVSEDEEKRDLFFNDLESVTQGYEDQSSRLFGQLKSWQAGVFAEGVSTAPDVFAAMSVLGGHSTDRQRCWQQLIRLAASDTSRSSQGSQQDVAEEGKQSEVGENPKGVRSGPLRFMCTRPPDFLR